MRLKAVQEEVPYAQYWNGQKPVADLAAAAHLFVGMGASLIQLFTPMAKGKGRNMTRRIILTMLALLLFLPFEGQAEQTLEDIMVPKLDYSRKDLPDLDSYRFVRDLKAGWNLGNTFDANNAGYLKDEMDYESTWVGLKTDPGVFEALRKAGFDTVRIPVSWHNHVSGDDFLISRPWLDRVKEVADAALSSELYVILNTHHDIQKGYIYPDREHLEQSKDYLRAIWTQVGEVFKEYDERLVLESMNEPRLAGTEIEWRLNADDPRSAESVQCINELNQVFVDAIRTIGSGNSTRYLLVPGYAASVQGSLHTEFQMPKDTVDNRLLLSVHAYTPYNFALLSPADKASKDTFSATSAFDVSEIATFMDQLYRKFTPLGVPIVIGEFGARDKGGNLQSRVDFAAVYVALARSRGFTCIWWDNHAFRGEGELFGLLDRRTFQFVYPEVVSAIVDNAQ